MMKIQCGDCKWEKKPCYQAYVGNCGGCISYHTKVLYLYKRKWWKFWRPE